MLIDEKAQISAEMILLMGALLIIVIVAGNYIVGISRSVAGNVSGVIDAARNSAINRMQLFFSFLFNFPHHNIFGFINWFKLSCIRFFYY
ncbi:MAG: class III signal peptide-containing protein [Methanobacterium sp.]